MKIYFILVLIALFAFASCSSGSSTKLEEQKIENMINALDSASMKIESVSDDIKESTEKLDALINDL